MAAPTVAFRSAHARDNGFAPREGFETFFESDAHTSLTARFEQVASRRGAATALVDGATRLSYRQLADRTNAAGAALAAELANRPGTVVIQASSTAAAVQAVLGVLRAGRAYLVLPPSLPDRLAHAAARNAAAVIVDEDADRSALPDLPWLCLSDLLSARSSRSPQHARPDDVACVFATSGTTGEPKLVGLSHRAVVFDVGRQINDLFLGPDDRIDLLSHCAFSASLSSIFSAFLSGAELHIGPAARLHALADWLSDSRITISTMTPSTFRTLCASLSRTGAVRELRLVSLGGETLFDRDVRMFDAAFPQGCVLQNAMASTETRTYAQYFVPRSAAFDGAVPIGWPVYRKDVIVVDQEGRAAGPGEEGEILVTSRYVADGYLNDPELTAARLGRQPDGAAVFRTRDRGRFDANGCLTFVGRSDGLVKILGHRVEPESLEAALLTDPRIRRAAVVRRRSPSGADSLAAFVVTDGSRCSEQEIREWLSRRLPVYAVPSAVRIEPELPLTSTGKVDYQRLGATLLTSPPLGAGRPSDDDRVAALQASWALALDREAVDPDRDFFAAGGDSLSALRLQLEVYRRLGCELALAALLQHPTPRRAAAFLARETTESSVVTLHAGGSGTPLFCVPGIGGEPLSLSHLAAHVGRDRPVYGFRATIASESRGPLRIETIAREYVDDLEGLAARGTSIHLCGHSFGAVVALEMMHQLRARGRNGGIFAVIDTPLGAGRPGVLGRMRDTLTNFPAWLWYDAFQSAPEVIVARASGKASEAWNRLRARVSSTPRHKYPDLRSYFGVRHVPIEVAQRMRARFDAIHRYERRPLPGGVVLFRSRAQALMGRSDRTLGWDALAASVEVVDVPGHHDSCTKPPHVETLALRLAERLRRADTR